MDTYKQNEALKEKIIELKRTINFLCNTIQNIIEDDEETEESISTYNTIVLREAINDKRYTFE